MLDSLAFVALQSPKASEGKCHVFMRMLKFILLGNKMGQNVGSCRVAARIAWQGWAGQDFFPAGRGGARQGSKSPRVLRGGVGQPSLVSTFSIIAVNEVCFLAGPCA